MVREEGLTRSLREFGALPQIFDLPISARELAFGVLVPPVETFIVDIALSETQNVISENGARGGTRTPDLLGVNQLL